MSFYGTWNASNTYIGSATIVSVVLYNSTYYIARYDVGGSFSSSTTPNNDTAHWNSFGASFSSIATGLLLAQEAYIANLIASQLATSSNPYHMLLSILDSALGIFRNKADAASISNAIVGIGKDISEMQESGQQKPAICIRDEQWQGTYSASTIYYKDDRVYYSGYTYIFKHDWLETETPTAGLLPTNSTYWNIIGSGNLGGGKYTEAGSEGLFSNGSNIQGLSTSLGIVANFTQAMLLQLQNASSSGISAAIFGLDQTSDSDSINASKSYGGWFNRLFIASEIDNVTCIDSSTAITLDKSSYHTIHYYGLSDINITLPAVNYRDVGLKFYFRKLNAGIINIYADSGHQIINVKNGTASVVSAGYGQRHIFIWDGNYWVDNFMN